MYYIAPLWIRLTTKEKFAEKDLWIYTYTYVYPTRCTIAVMHA